MNFKNLKNLTNCFTSLIFEFPEFPLYWQVRENRCGTTRICEYIRVYARIENIAALCARKISVF